jgi:hypothetical protein
MNCSCISRVNTILKTKAMELAVTYDFVTTNPVLGIKTRYFGTITRQAPAVVPSFCPFCGTKIGERTEVTHE